jgi:uncharacterized protein (TIRG00374 family)
MISKQNKPINFESILKKLFVIIPVSILFNFVFALIFTDLDILANLNKFNLSLLIMAIFLRLVPWLTKTIRLHNWLKLLDYDISFWQSLKITVTAELGSIVSPTMMGGEVLYADMLYRRGVSIGKAVSITSFAAVENFIFYILFIPLSLVLTPGLMENVTKSLAGIEKIQLLLIFFSAVIIFMIVLLVLKQFAFGQKIHNKIRKNWHEFKALYLHMAKKGKTTLIKNLFFTAIQWISRYSVITLLLISLGENLNFLKAMVFQWMVFLIMHIVPTPGATGGAEGAFLIFYKNIISAESVGIALIGWRFIDYYLLGIISIIILSIEKYVLHIDLKKT